IISPIPDKVAEITNSSKPEIVKELRRLFAIFNVYRRVIPDAVRTKSVLNSTSNYREPKGMIEHPSFGLEILLLHFRSAKGILITVVYQPAVGALLCIVVYASDTAVGAVLHQQRLER
ncbi:hypothetical protein NPIL_392921, partial [Nephila pilipes]